MGLRIGTNITALNAQRSLYGNRITADRSMARLASGNRINQAADDAAGLAISERLKGQIRGLRQANRNANDGISMVQVAEGGLNEISNILTRMRELGIQAASDTVGEKERTFINSEVQQIKQESQRIVQTTSYGKTHLIDGSGGSFDFQVGINNNDFEDRISYDAADTNAQLSELGLEDFDFSTKEGAQRALDIVDQAQTKVNGYRANLGALQNRLQSTVENLGVSYENLSAANSRIRDTDVAKATAESTRNNILLQSSTNVLTQANSIPNLALKLIG
jgi:flagellin